jgi:hypothetical protein
MAARVRSGQVRVELLGAFRVVLDGAGFADTVTPQRKGPDGVAQHLEQHVCREGQRRLLQPLTGFRFECAGAG